MSEARENANEVAADIAAEGDDHVPAVPDVSQLPDARLVAAHDLARAALLEITAESTIGNPAGYTVEDNGVVSLRFANTLPGYPGWFWTVSLARVGGEDPTVLEVELLPGDGALLAPEWVPWAVRLAEYRANLAAQAGGNDDDDDEDDESFDDDDSSDDDDDEDMDDDDDASDGFDDEDDIDEHDLHDDFDVIDEEHDESDDALDRPSDEEE